MGNSRIETRPRLRSAAIVALAAGLACICSPAGQTETAFAQATKPAATSADPNCAWPTICLNECDVDLIHNVVLKDNAACLPPALAHSVLTGQAWHLPFALIPLTARELYTYWPGTPPKIVPSRQTTRILGPLNDDGTADYLKYVDDKYSKGVTADNNAAELLLRAIGPDLFASKKVRKKTLQRLKLPASFFHADKRFVKWEDRTRHYESGVATSKPSEPEEADRDANEPSMNDVFAKLLAGQRHPDIEAWLAENAGPLELVRQATAKDRLYLPLISTDSPPDLARVWIPNMGSVSQAGRALAIRAVLEMNRNDCPGAWDDVLAAHRLARLTGQGPTLVEQIVAIGVDEFAARVGIALATRGNMTAAQYRETLGKLQAFGHAGDVLRAIDEMERFSLLEVVAMAYRGTDIRELLTGKTDPRRPATFGHNVDWNQAFRAVNYWMDRQIRPHRLPLFHGREEAQKAYEDDFGRLKAIATVRPNRSLLWLVKQERRMRLRAVTHLITNAMACGLVPTLVNHIHPMEEQSRMTGEIEKLAVALGCFHAAHGRWPGKLNELSPGLLKTIPKDIFSDKPLVYKPGKNGYLLYSVGRDDVAGRDECDARSPEASPDNRKHAIVAEVKPKR